MLSVIILEVKVKGIMGPKWAGSLTRRFRVVIEYKQTRVISSSKLTNLNIKSLIKEYSDE